MRYGNGPNRIKDSFIFEGLVENIDIPATIIDLCGFEVPKWMHGKSLVGVMEGRDIIHKDMVFSEGGVEPHALEGSFPYDHESYVKSPNYYFKQRTMIDYPFTMTRSKMIRTKKWKFVYRINGMKELYDLEKDPMELRDVSSDPEHRELICNFIEQSREVVYLAGHSKFDTIAHITVCPISGINKLITDSSTGAEKLDQCKNMGVDVVVAE
jgi:arylsulfatase A-like enzyme